MREFAAALDEAERRYCRKPTFTSSSDSSRTGTGFACQMSRAYSRMVRSEENIPERALLRIDMRTQESMSRIARADTRCWHSR